MRDEAHLQEAYFTWLQFEALDHPSDRLALEGLFREMHDIPFYWTMILDSNRAGDAISFRQFDFLECLAEGSLEHVNKAWLINWATAAPSVLEVLMGMSRRWAFYFEKPASYFFKIMLQNLHLHHYTGEHLTKGSREQIRNILDTWMSRTFQPNGDGSPFPVRHALHVFDMTEIDIWAQMNAYSAEHFQ